MKKVLPPATRVPLRGESCGRPRDLCIHSMWSRFQWGGERKYSLSTFSAPCIHFNKSPWSSPFRLLFWEKSTPSAPTTQCTIDVLNWSYQKSAPFFYTHIPVPFSLVPSGIASWLGKVSYPSLILKASPESRNQYLKLSLWGTDRKHHPRQFHGSKQDVLFLDWFFCILKHQDRQICSSAAAPCCELQ